MTDQERIAALEAQNATLLKLLADAVSKIPASPLQFYPQPFVPVQPQPVIYPHWVNQPPMPYYGTTVCHGPVAGNGCAANPPIGFSLASVSFN